MSGLLDLFYQYTNRDITPRLLDGKRKRIVDSVTVGNTPKRLKEEVQTMVCKFHDFANLTQVRDEDIMSPSIQAFGYGWNLDLYPGGDSNSCETIKYMSCYIRKIHPVGDDIFFATCNFRCKDRCATFPKIHSLTSDWHGFPDFLQRKDVLENYLDEDGTLVIEVDMQIAVDKENDDDVWYPKLNIPNDMLTQIYHSSFEDDTNTSDVVFDVDGKEFHGHKSVLSVRTRTISELMKGSNNTNKVGVIVVPIPNMESDIFEGVLKFVYCVEKPTIEDKATAIKYLLAADRLGVVDLKMFVESIIVEKLLDTSNAAEMLVLADSHSCPLLKEATMKLYDTNTDVVMESEGWSQIEESPRLLVELLRFCKCKVKQKQSSSSAVAAAAAVSDNQHAIDDVTNLDVTSLRERLLEAKLDIDGNQEILIERLQDHLSSTAATVVANPPPPH